MDVLPAARGVLIMLIIRLESQYAPEGPRVDSSPHQ